GCSHICFSCQEAPLRDSETREAGGWHFFRLTSGKSVIASNVRLNTTQLQWGVAAGMLVGMSEVTNILAAAEQGDPKAAELLLPLVYDELRRLAAAKLAQETPGQTLQPTAL